MIGFIFGGVALLINSLIWFFWVGTGPISGIPIMACVVIVIIYLCGGIVPFYLGWLTRKNFGGGAGAIELPAYAITIVFGSTIVFKAFQLF